MKEEELKDLEKMLWDSAEKMRSSVSVDNIPVTDQGGNIIIFDFESTNEISSISVGGGICSINLINNYNFKLQIQKW